MNIIAQGNTTETQNQIGVQQLLATFRRYFHIPDEIGFSIVMACAIAHHIPGEMLWIRVYGGSRSGKTELFRAIAEQGDSAKMETITPASIRGGLGKGSRLLERIDGKLVITKDLASMLTSKRELRNEVFGLMRNVKDGELVSDFGTEDGHLHQHSKFDWLIATTPVFAQYRTMEDLLGSRFIDLKWQATDREEMTLRALENNSSLPTIRQEMAEATGRLMDHYKTMPAPELDDDTKNLIVCLADLTAKLRSPIARDNHHRVKFQPEAEVGTSLAQNLDRIARALRLMGITEITPHLIRLCLDSIPHSRIEILSELVNDEVSTANRNWYDFDDLRLLGICDKTERGYRLKSDLKWLIEIFIKWR